MPKTLTNIFNKLVQQEEQEFTIKQLKEYAKKTKTKVLKEYISNRTNNDWDKASKNAMDMYGTTLTELIGKRNSPAEKKSPSKKRGYKMKRNK